MIPSTQNEIRDASVVAGLRRIVGSCHWTRPSAETGMDTLLLRQPGKDFKWYGYRKLTEYALRTFDLDGWKWGEFDPEGRKATRDGLVSEMAPEIEESKAFGYEDGAYGYYPDDGIHDGRPYVVDRMSGDGVGTGAEDYADAIIALCDCVGARERIGDPGLTALFDAMPIGEKMRLIHDAVREPGADIAGAVRGWQLDERGTKAVHGRDAVARYLRLRSSACGEHMLSDLFREFPDEEIKEAVRSKPLGKLSPFRVGMGDLYGGSYEPDLTGYIQAGETLDKLRAVACIWDEVKAENGPVGPMDGLSLAIGKAVSAKAAEAGNEQAAPGPERHRPRVHVPGERPVGIREVIDVSDGENTGPSHGDMGEE